VESAVRRRGHALASRIHQRHSTYTGGVLGRCCWTGLGGAEAQPHPPPLTTPFVPLSRWRLAKVPNKEHRRGVVVLNTAAAGRRRSVGMAILGRLACGGWRRTRSGYHRHANGFEFCSFGFWGLFVLFSVGVFLRAAHLSRRLRRRWANHAIALGFGAGIWCRPGSRSSVAVGHRVAMIGSRREDLAGIDPMAATGPNGYGSRLSRNLSR